MRLFVVLAFRCCDVVAPPIVLDRKHEKVQLRYLEKPGMKRPPKSVYRLPSCLRETGGVGFLGLDPVDAGTCRGSKCVIVPTDVHIGFYDSNPSSFHEPDFVGMMRIVNMARALESSGVGISAHVIVLREAREAPVASVSEVPGGLRVYRIFKRDIARLAMCLHVSLQRLVRGSYRSMWKPLMHLLLPASVEKLLMLDNDVILVQPLSRLWYMRSVTSCQLFLCIYWLASLKPRTPPPTIGARLATSVLVRYLASRASR